MKLKEIKNFDKSSTPMKTMKKRSYYLIMILGFLDLLILQPTVIFPIPSTQNPMIAQNTIEFSGYTWNIKDSANDYWGPGPNRWNSTNQSVWVDANGHLHLKIRLINGFWHCAEVFTTQSFGYGKYSFTLTPGFENLDPNIILGLFTYYNDTQEIDIEYSRWGQTDANNGQFVVQPSTSQNIYRYPVASTNGSSIHSFIWTEKCILFETRWNSSIFEGITRKESWNYTGSAIPLPRTERVHLNLWLMQGLAPMNGQGAEVVIEQFKFEPLDSMTNELSCTHTSDTQKKVDGFGIHTLIIGIFGLSIVISRRKKMIKTI
jgi:hypothetical protein